MAASFLQSGEWEEFQRSLGRKTWRAKDVLIVRHAMPFGMNYLYCPRPDTGRWTPDAGIWKEARRIARKENSVFLKIDPIDAITFPAFIVHRSLSSLQPQKTVILDIQRSEDNLLAGMHEKTRYNIRLAGRKAVRIVKSGPRVSRRERDLFWQLLKETAARDQFRAHERRHYELLLDARSESFSNELFFAEHEGVALACAVVNFYRPGGTAAYLHGASNRLRKEVMASQLLHWEIALEAKRRGFSRYDFWGIDEEKWPGLTRFKRGFGGREIAYPRSIDVVYRPIAYAAYRIAKKIKS